MYNYILVPLDGSERAEAIVRAADCECADLIAMASHGRTGMS